MNCTNCGNTINDGNTFCTECGTAVTVTEAPAQENINAKADTVPQGNPTASSVPQGAPVYNQAYYGQPVITEEQLPPQFKPMGAWSYFGHQLLFSIPLVGFILLIVFAVGGTENINKRNFARSYFCAYLLAAIISIIILVFAVIFGISMGASEVISDAVMY